MGDRAFGMLCGHIGVTGLAMLDGFVEMLDPFIHMWILRGRPRMLECFLSMLHKDIGMPLFAMRHSFLGMFQSFSRMLVGGKGEPAEQRETNKRGNRCHNKCSATDSYFHGSSSVVKVHLMGERYPRHFLQALPYTAIFSLSRRPYLWLDVQNFLQSLGVFFHRTGKIPTPFPPGSRIIADLPIPGEFEDKIQPG